MKIVGLIDEDFTQYKKPSMFIAMPYCDFKCEKDCGKKICQNSELAKAEKIDIEVDNLIKRYLANPITKAVVFGGMDPFNSFKEVYNFIYKLREEYTCSDDVVIYTGYNLIEVMEQWNDLRRLINRYEGSLIVKFGRFIPDQLPHYDDVLGIELASDNQYAKEVDSNEIC